MTSRSKRRISFAWRAIATDDDARHESLVGLFGTLLMRIRRGICDATSKRLRDEERRHALQKPYREFHEILSRLPKEQVAAVEKLATFHGDRFVQQILLLLSNQGFDLKLDEDHAIRLRLNMEVIDRTSGNVVHDEVLNRGGEKMFDKYWIRWVNEDSSTE